MQARVLELGGFDWRMFRPGAGTCDGPPFVSVQQLSCLCLSLRFHGSDCAAFSAGHSLMNAVATADDSLLNAITEESRQGRPRLVHCVHARAMWE